MRRLLACLMMLSAFAWAAGEPAKGTGTPPVPSVAKGCADCGVVRSVRMVKKELRTDPKDDARPSGLVASIPLGGSGKPTAGSSARIGKDAVTTTESWEVVIHLDDGRYRLSTFDHPPELREGDKVRIDANGRVQLRTD